MIKKTTTWMNGILIICNRATIIWHSKQQNGVETSAFGSDFMVVAENEAKKKVQISMIIPPTVEEMN